jgi:hypothetical protein
MTDCPTRGETVIVDANGFLFWAIGEYVPLQLLHDLGDFAGDGLVGIRYAGPFGRL